MMSKRRNSTGPVWYRASELTPGALETRQAHERYTMNFDTFPQVSPPESPVKPTSPQPVPPFAIVLSRLIDRCIRLEERSVSLEAEAMELRRMIEEVLP
jgi:hypothetical protein